MNRKTRPFYKKEEYLYGKYVVAEPPKPEIVNESFPFTLVYKLEGKKKVIKDTMICQYPSSVG